MKTYNSEQLNAYKNHIRETINNNKKYGTDYKHYPISEFKWETCVLCDQMITDDLFGHNPSPVKNDGVCCSACNRTKVIPARISTFRNRLE